MMCPGANGSAATLTSINMKRKKSGKEIQSEVMVIGADQESFEPRSKPMSRNIVATTSTNAPKKSIRRSLVFQLVGSCLGSFKMIATLTKAAAQIGACARKALDNVSFHPSRSHCQDTIAN